MLNCLGCFSILVAAITLTMQSCTLLQQSYSASHPISYDEFGSGANESDSATRGERSVPSLFSVDASGGRHKDKALRIAREFGINLSKPKYPQYAVKATRLGTYQNWSLSVTHKPEEMAEAGLFYSGTYDYEMVLLKC
jgi:hypothetical protein